MKVSHTTFKLLFLLTISCSAINAFAVTLTVTKTQDTSDGMCDDDCSLREAVADAMSGDTIVFSPLFNSPQTITLFKGYILIDKNLTIMGPGSGLLSISGNNAGLIFIAVGGQPALHLTGMHLRNARNDVSGFGGAIYLNGSLTASSMVFSNNYCRFVGSSGTFGEGSAIFGQKSTIDITNSSFYNNTSFRGTVESEQGSVKISNSSVSDNDGGGVGGSTVQAIESTFHGNAGQAVGAHNLTLKNCNVTNNRNGGAGADVSMVIDRSTIAFNRRFNSLSQFGGGIENYGQAIITNSTIANNSVNGDGGGIRNTGTIYLRDSSVVNNTAGLGGGGIWNAKGAIYLTNITVSGNRANRGAGIQNYYDGVNPGARIFLTNSTVAFNRSGIGPGGIVNEPGGIATLRNSIVNKNTRNQDLYDISGVIASQGFNMIGPQNDSGPWLPSDMVGVINPFLAPLGSNGSATLTHALYPKSPAINAGSNSLAVDPQTKLALGTDQRGWARVAGDVVDIGAYEANYSPLPVSLTGSLVTTTGRGIAGARVTLNGEAGDIRYAITNPFGYFRFPGLPAGSNYTLTGSDKLYTFTSSITLTTDQDRDDLIFHGLF